MGYIIRKPAKVCISYLNFTYFSVPHEVRTVKGTILSLFSTWRLCSREPTKK